MEQKPREFVIVLREEKSGNRMFVGNCYLDKGLLGTAVWGEAREVIMQMIPRIVSNVIHGYRDSLKSQRDIEIQVAFDYWLEKHPLIRTWLQKNPKEIQELREAIINDDEDKIAQITAKITVDTKLPSEN